MRVWLSFFYFTAFIALPGCFKSPTAPYLKVGSFDLSKEDVKLRNEVIRVYNPREQRDLGERQLIKAFKTAQILKNYGFDISDRALENEARRINSSTKLPEVLERIKAVFKGDEKLYRRIYILPVYVQRVSYYEFFLSREDFHKKSLAKANELLDRLQKNPKEISQLAKEGYPSQKISVSLKEGLQPAQERDSIAGPAGSAKRSTEQKQIEKQMKQEGLSASQKKAKLWISDIALKHKAGDIFARVINEGDHWKVARFLGPIKGKKGYYLFETISIPKDNFDEWMEKEKEKIPVKKV